MNKTIEIKINKLGINGEGIGYYNKKICFVPNALPNEVVKAEIVKDNEKFLDCKLIEIITNSNDRVIPKCKYYEACGGCSLMHLNYEKSLEFKRELIIESIKKYTNLNPYSFEIKKVIGMENPYHYRNKSQLPYQKNKSVVYGIYKANSNILVPITNCLVQREALNDANFHISRLMDKHHILPYDKKSRKGCVRYVVVRESIKTNEMQVTFILENNKTDLSKFIEDVLKIENVVSVYTDINSNLKSNDIFGNKLTKIKGENTIKEGLGDFHFSLLPNAFFQLNPVQTVKLYDCIKKASKLSGKEVVFDAYCGVGTIGIWVAKNALEVIGVETNKEAITSANYNAINNKIKNITFICDDVAKQYKMIAKQKNIDVLLLDPPRTGLGSEMCDLILEHLPKRVVYTSCNISTFAKDLNVLSKKYNVKYIQPVDMFPQTAHVECVCQLVLKNLW